MLRGHHRPSAAAAASARATFHTQRRMTRPDFSRDLDVDGVLVVPAAVQAEALASLWSCVQAASCPGLVATRSTVYGARSLLTARPELRQVLVDLHLDDVARRALGRAVFPLDAVFFDKNANANWAVPAHQDLVVPVPSSVPSSAVRNLRARHGTVYAEPPVSALQELVAVRVHFDDASASSGGLFALVGSHARGRWSDADLRQIRSDAFRPYDCSAGDLLLMKPLVVHRSPRATRPERRRVLHLLYAPADGWHASTANDTGTGAGARVATEF